MDILIRQIRSSDQAEWLRLRLAFWPEHEHRLSEFKAEIEEITADPEQPVFVAVRPDGSLCGLLEVSICSEAEGCSTDRIGYLEGWYVDLDLRKKNIGRYLVEAAEKWTREQGCSEMASDTTLDYPLSPAMHARLGYQEAQCTVHFRKEL
jgi:aminoglycoside 6'-N-acetyltransferase I